ncbi:hypothetical protein CPB85DRAFT_130083 [Mucidula mucida]|nr:hypothetical protein CPB85DRAFT_130083 [Mucidula mucida]
MRPMIYSFLAAAYVEGLAALKVSAPSVFQDTMDYLSTSNNLVVLCLILALADDDRRRRSLQVLSAFLTADRWAACLSELQDFLAKDNAPRVWYNRYKKDFDLETLYIVYGGPPETLRFSVFEDVLLDYVAPAKRSVSAPESSSATYDSTAVASPATNNRWVRPLRRLLAMRGGDNMELGQRHSNSSQHSDGIV